MRSGVVAAWQPLQFWVMNAFPKFTQFTSGAVSQSMSVNGSLMASPVSASSAVPGAVPGSGAY